MRRRRECSGCGERFTTYEYVEGRTIQVLKRDGSAEDYDREKLLKSLRIACAKRPVSASQVEALVDGIEDDLSKRAGVEVPSAHLGEMVMDGLKPLDRVAYVRFASVYPACFGKTELPQAAFEILPRHERSLFLATFGLGLVTTEEDVATDDGYPQ